MPLYGQSGYGTGRYGIQDNGPIYKEPLGYYLDLIRSQYRLQPKFMKWLQKAVQPIDDLTNMLAFMSGQFDLNVAVGAQLDILGLLIGQGRTVGFQPSNNVSPILDDNTYRLLLKAKRAWNTWNGLLVSLPTIWQDMFPSGRLIVNDNQNMSCTIILNGSFNSILQDLVTNGYIVPRPEGVEYIYSFGTLPILGADLNNTFIAGADLGHAI